jgi:hypothetical protein
MQKTATKIFIGASIAFGIVGLLIVFTSGGPDNMDTAWDQALVKMLFTCVFIILPSFALSIAAKYLDGKI